EALRLHVLGTLIGPAHTIIGPPAGTGLYSAANGSIAGNGPHNPFLAGTVSFDLTGSFLASTTVSSATFSFGTAEGNNVHAVVPEPTTLLLLASGLVALGGLVGRKRWGGTQVI